MLRLIFVARAYSKANEILVKSSAIQTFPFLPKDLVKEQTPIACRSFKKARKYGVDITAFGSESAIIMSFQGKKIIFYDETKPDTHNRFSIMFKQKVIDSSRVICISAFNVFYDCHSYHLPVSVPLFSIGISP